MVINTKNSVFGLFSVFEIYGLLFELFGHMCVMSVFWIGLGIQGVFIPWVNNRCCMASSAHDQIMASISPKRIRPSTPMDKPHLSLDLPNPLGKRKALSRLKLFELLIRTALLFPQHPL
jgi:hypothetical protein